MESDRLGEKLFDLLRSGGVAEVHALLEGISEDQRREVLGYMNEVSVSSRHVMVCSMLAVLRVKLGEWIFE